MKFGQNLRRVLVFETISKYNKTYLKLTQCPFDPVEAKRGLDIIAETVLAAFGSFGSCDVSKNANPPKNKVMITLV